MRPQGPPLPSCAPALHNYFFLLGYLKIEKANKKLSNKTKFSLLYEFFNKSFNSKINKNDHENIFYETPLYKLLYPFLFHPQIFSGFISSPTNLFI